MKRALILCLFLAINANIESCSAAYFPPLQPLGGNNIQPALSHGGSGVTSLPDPFARKPYSPSVTATYPKIDKIERSLYGSNFPTQDIMVRLSRIETSIFSTTYPDSPLVQRVDNIIANYNQINDYQMISKNILSKMETKILHQNYSKNDVQNRIERLEQQIFGAVQSGDIPTRYETLKTAVNNYNRNQDTQTYSQIPLDTLSQGSVNPRRRNGILANLGSMLLGGGGVMTGFSPSIDPLSTGYNNGYSGFNNYSGNNNYYSNGYNNNRYNNNYSSLASPSGYGYYSGNRTNRGYSDAFNTFGSSSGVTILD